MDSANGTTPSWLVGLLIFFSLAAAASFGALLYRHAEYAGLSEEMVLLDDRSRDLEPIVTLAEREPAILDQQITDRRALLKSLEGTEAVDMSDVDRLINHNKEILAANAESQNRELATFNQAIKDAADRRAELGTEEESQYNNERENDDRRRELRDNVEKMSQTIEQKKKDARDANAELDARIAELVARVQQLTQQQDLAKRDFKSAGQILASAAADGFVVINRGHHQNLRNGTKFAVFNKRGGRIVIKGEVQVINVEDDISTARVLAENDKNDPLIVGDYLHNPIYDPEKVLHFAVRGDFLRYSKEELAQFIKDSGDVVDPEVTVRTDYLVAGTSSGAALDQAKKLGVSILSEDQLIDFVSVQSHIVTIADLQAVKNAAAQGRTFALIGKFTVADKGLVEKWIAKYGGKTTGSVHAGVDVVVAGDDDADDIAQARKLGIPVVDQSQFSHLDAASVEK